MECRPANEHTELVAQYVGEKTGAVFTPGMYQALMVVNSKGEFCAGVIVSEYRGIDCQMSVAAETPAVWRPHVLRAVFQYVFVQIGCVRCTATTRKTNMKARSFLEGLGFKLEGNLRKGFDGVKDSLIYGLLAEECRFLEGFSDGVGSEQREQQGQSRAADEPEYASEAERQGEREPAAGV